MSKRGRKMTVKGIVNQSIKNNIGWAKYYRDLNKTIRDIGNSLPIGLPVENLEIDSYQLVYCPETKEQANSIRAEVGKIGKSMGQKRKPVRWFCSIQNTSKAS